MISCFTVCSSSCERIFTHLRSLHAQLFFPMIPLACFSSLASSWKMPIFTQWTTKESARLSQQIIKKKKEATTKFQSPIMPAHCKRDQQHVKSKLNILPDPRLILFVLVSCLSVLTRPIIYILPFEWGNRTNIRRASKEQTHTNTDSSNCKHGVDIRAVK